MAQRPGGWPYDSQGYASYQAGGSTGAGTGPQGGGMPPGDFTRLSQTISSNVQRMVNNVSQIETMNGMIGTVSDNPELRDRLHKLQHETNQLAKSITQQLKDLSNIPASQDPQQQRQRKFQKDRLMDEFTTALKNFQMSQRRQKEREKEAIQRTKNKASSPMDPYAEEELVNGQLVGDSSGRQQMALSHEDDLELLHDREMSVRQLEADIMDVNQIFKELSVLVHEQGEVVDSIEANVESTSLNIARGTEQLQQARNYKARIRERKFCLLIILIAILVIVAIIIGVSVSH